VPRYGESDIFLLSGAEDLVPMVIAAGDLDERPRTVGGVGYTEELDGNRLVRSMSFDYRQSNGAF
jgi:hypothetical protein